MSRPVTLVFLVDALGWEIAEHFGFGREHFATRASLGTVLGYSAAAIPSLLSGATPAEHGSWAMFRRSDATGSFQSLRWIPPLPHKVDWRARKYIRRWLDRRGAVKSYYDLYEIPAHLLHRFDLGQTGDPFRPGGLARETVFDWMHAEGIRYQLWDYRTGEGENMRAARANDVELEIVLLSDHGMTDVTDTVDVWQTLAKHGWKVGRDYLAFFDSTMARTWGGEGVADAVTLALEGKGRRLDAPQLRAFGCYFPDGSYGDDIFLADPGVLIVPSFMGARRIAAMHGYHPEDRFSRGVFMTDAPMPAPASI